MPKLNVARVFERRVSAMPSAPPITKTSRRLTAIAPLRKPLRERAAAECLAALVQDHQSGAIGNHVGERNQFFELAALGILGAAFLDLDDLDGSECRYCGRPGRRASDSARQARLPQPSCGRPRAPARASVWSLIVWSLTSSENGYAIFGVMLRYQLDRRCVWSPCRPTTSFRSRRNRGLPGGRRERSRRPHRSGPSRNAAGLRRGCPSSRIS